MPHWFLLVYWMDGEDQLQIQPLNFNIINGNDRNEDMFPFLYSLPLGSLRILESLRQSRRNREYRVKI